MVSRKHDLLGRYDLFIFDWDGTLNSMRTIMKVNESIKRKLHLWNRDSNMKNFRSMDYDLKKRIESEEKKNDILTYLFDVLLNLSRPKLHNNSLKTIKILRSSGKKVAIFSNGRSYRLIKELDYLGIANYFDTIVSARELNALKPNPTGLKLIINALKVKPGRCLYIGDMVDDIITAKLAHVDSCAIADGFDSYHKLRSVRPDYIFKSIEEMGKAL